MANILRVNPEIAKLTGDQQLIVPAYTMEQFYLDSRRAWSFKENSTGLAMLRYATTNCALFAAQLNDSPGFDDAWKPWPLERITAMFPELMLCAVGCGRFWSDRSKDLVEMGRFWGWNRSMPPMCWWCSVNTCQLMLCTPEHMHTR